MHPKLLSGRCHLKTRNFWNVTRNIYQTHYEVLKVKRDSSNKEIKDAFIKLSKQYHPDTTKCANSHSKFVKIVEAYSVLSKPDLRRNYDLGLIIEQDAINPDKSYQSRSSQKNPADDPIFWNNRNKSQDEYYASKPYYGIKGLKRVSNSTIVLVCLLVTAVGVTLQVIAISASVTLKRDKMLKASAEAEKIVTDLQEEANRYGNKVQMEKMMKRMEEQNFLKR